MPSSGSVLESPAVELLCRLEEQGFDLAVHGGRLRVAPSDRLSAAQEAEIRQYRDDLVLLVRICLPISNTDLTFTQGGDDAESVSQSPDPVPSPRPVPQDQTLEPVTRSTVINVETRQDEEETKSMRATTFLSEFIKAETVKLGPMMLKIADCEAVEFKDEKSGRVDRKLALVVDDGQKLVLNVENNRTLIDGFGIETDNWIGRTIEAYYEPNVTFGGKKVGGLRVRVPQSDDAVEAVL